MFRIRVECVLEKPVEVIFAILSDHENYRQFPGINASRLLEVGTLEKNGQGALREIVAGQFRFVERITHFDRPWGMHYRIEALSPIPMHHLRGEITLESVDGKTRVLWVSEGHMTVPVLGLFLDKIVEYQISRAFLAILKQAEARAEDCPEYASDP